MIVDCDASGLGFSGRRWRVIMVRLPAAGQGERRVIDHPAMGIANTDRQEALIAIRENLPRHVWQSVESCDAGCIVVNKLHPLLIEESLIAI